MRRLRSQTVIPECGKQADHSVRHTLARLREAVVLRHLRVWQTVEAAPVFHQFAARDKPLKINARDFSSLQILGAHEPSLLRERKEPVGMGGLVLCERVSFPRHLFVCDKV